VAAVGRALAHLPYEIQQPFGDRFTICHVRSHPRYRYRRRFPFANTMLGCPGGFGAGYAVTAGAGTAPDRHGLGR
jgi:hypothetical protein